MKEKEQKPKKAVALKYTSEMSAPQVTASGQGSVADKILAVAQDNHIPVHEDPVLVEALGQLDIGQEIPPELYQVVAEILAFIINIDKGYKP